MGQQKVMSVTVWGGNDKGLSWQVLQIFKDDGDFALGLRNCTNLEHLWRTDFQQDSPSQVWETKMTCRGAFRDSLSVRAQLTQAKSGRSKQVV